MAEDLKSYSVVRPFFEFSFSQEFPFMLLLPWNSLGWGGNVQEWLVFSDYAPESNLIPTFVIVPFFKKIVFVFLNHAPETYLIVTIVIVQPGLHNLCHPTIQDGSTWSKFRARGEHGDVFLFSNLGAPWFSENLNRYSLHVCLGEVKNNLFSFKHSYLRHFSWRF